MKNLKVIIGIEIHVVLNSITKMFSPSKNSHNDKPNQNIDPIDLGLPGILPSPNLECIKKAIVLAKSLNMDISNSITFDRKNYFYQDLPKGFQITQQFNPIGKNGYIFLNDKKIDIERIHLEEDTAKQFFINDDIYLDYNRSGLPLIEIVSSPTISSPTEAAEYIKGIRRILLFNNISDAKLEEGSMRADINISLMPIGSKTFGTKVEIKNINSISNVEKAINFEIDRQSKLLFLNKTIDQETRKFNDSNNTTEFLRKKIDAIEYRYMTEPNIYKRDINKEFINKIILENFIDLAMIKNELVLFNISDELINIILEDPLNYKIFSIVNKICNDPINTSKWIFLELSGLLYKDNKSFIDFPINRYEEIGKIILKLNNSEINGKQSKDILKYLYETKLSCEEIIEKYNFKQIDDKQFIELTLEKYIKENISLLDQYKNRPERVEKFFLGLLMKETKGQANPTVSNLILIDLINKYLTKI